MFFRTNKKDYLLNADVIIQARMGSSRLPGKIMLNLDNHSILDYVIKQLKNSKIINKIVIATTQDDSDNVIVEYAQKNRLLYFRGNKEDVLDRYYQCAKKFSINNIVRVTSDCPLIDPQIIDYLIEIFVRNDLDYATNKLPIDSPSCNQGAEVEIFSFKTLEKIWNDSKKPSEREHVTPYIYNNPSQFKISNVPSKGMNSLRYTIDRENDLELVRKIVSLIKNRPILTNDIETLFKTNPSLFQINSEYERNEGYFKSTQNEK
jgi:spore coat polysaccharide biosynthesis protein SpsF